MVAWLITMVPGKKQEVIAILNYRLSSRKVCAIMELLYINQREGLNSRLEYAKTGKAGCTARKALVDGLPYSEELWCGSGDRFFWARKVDDLKVITNAQGYEELTWMERKRPDLSGIREVIGLPPP